MLSRIKNSNLLVLFVALILLLFLFSGKSPLSKGIESKSSIVSVILNSCSGDISNFGSKETCYSKEFEKLAEKFGPDFSFEVLSILQQKDSEAKGCHLISHGIGTGSYIREPNNWQTLVQSMSTSCNYGGIHGVIQGYIGSLPNKSLTEDVIPTICGKTPRADCNHIVGHLLLVETEANIDKALDLCQVFTDNGQKDFCQTGVFMEYQTALNLIDHGIVPKSWQNWPERLEELEKICRSYDGDRAIACWTEIIHVALVKFNNDSKSIFYFCDSAQVLEGARRCKRHSLGVMAASKNFNLASLKSICSIPQKNDPNFEMECYPNLVSSALSTIPTEVPEAVSFCNSLDNKFKQSCFSMIGSMSAYGQISQEQLQNTCKVADPEFRNYCLGQSSSNQDLYIRNND